MDTNPEQTPVPPVEEPQAVPPEAAAVPPAEPNADQLREEKCAPVVYGMIDDMAAGLIPEDGISFDLQALEMKVLQRAFDADLNVTTENPYIFQLALGVLGALNATVSQATFTPIDDVRFARIARKILGFLKDAKVRLNPPAESDVAADFAPIKEQVNTLFAEEKITALEARYLMTSILEAFKNLQTGFMTSVENSSAKAEAKLFGVQEMSDVTMGTLDKVLKS